ncbi:class I poly(R)-hydroxyalkanoic acid synthase [Ammonicoccus fulvus]|uniref:Class I poly(R)-hydroxyalkanoic acid synthase n=1 Tax=Ammonicoccus fulvus TaxID=3138240 RepID=A0ABZ3FM30_9ACTN
MATPTDPTKWITDVVNQQKAVLLPMGDPTGATKALTEAMAPWTKAFNDMTQAQLKMFQQMTAPMMEFFSPWLKMIPGAEAFTKPITDKRFAGEAWQDPRFEPLARTYLATTEAMFKALDSVQMDERQKAQWQFALRQITDAASPSNTLLTNPEAIEKAMETGGASLVDGAKLFAEDLAQGRISQTDMEAFEVGKNVGTTKGSVVLRTELFELIHYAATTEQVYSTPLVIIPPAINKYYILDLQDKNSFVGHAVAEGHNVFLVSWRNVDEGQADGTWDDYIESILTAIAASNAIAGADQAQVLGFCIGGTLLSSALAVAHARGHRPAKSLTLLTTLLDFSEPGEIGLLLSEDSLKQQEQQIGGGGVFEGKQLANVFSSLRANDLIWNYVSTGYLKGQAPPAFDILFWNADSSNLPGPMFCWYLRNMYIENNLKTPGGTVQGGVPVDLGKVDLPAFVFAAKEDHIVLWGSAYESSKLLGGDTKFVLGASGHIAGVVNPPAKKKRNYWLAGEGTQGADAETWLEKAESVPGSWWPEWYKWLEQYAGEKVDAPKNQGNDTFPVLEAAPGQYVKVKVV